MEHSKIDIRKDYAKQSLNREDLADSPEELLKRWLSEAAEVDAFDYNAMYLSTVNQEGKPSGRIVLLRGLEESGLRFYTNYTSSKGKDIASNPHVAVAFFWKELERQVRIEGTAYRLTTKESDAYYATRPRSSQIGAWASQQSESNDQDDLEQRFEAMSEKFKDSENVPRPEHWGGFRVAITSCEFWQGRPNRLHQRWRYDRGEAASEWRVTPLDP